MRAMIVGASGFIGQELLRLLGPDQALGTYRSKPFPGGIRFDAQTMRLPQLPVELAGNFTHGIILIANATMDECARDPERSWDMNVRAVIDLVHDLRAAGIVPVFASSDAVFDGRLGNYREDDEPCPILTYGRHKAEVERFFRTLPGPWLVLRMSKTVGIRPGWHALIGEWLEDLRAGRVLRCAQDQRFAPADVSDVGRGIMEFARRNITGLFNLGGPHPMSRLELLELLVQEVSRLVPIRPQIVPCSIRDFPFLEPRPLDTSLDSAKAQALLSFRFRTMKALCADAARAFAGAAATVEPG